MGSYKLSKLSDNVTGFIESRDKLYYSKYKYRARYYCIGLDVLMWATTEDRVKLKLIQHHRKYHDANSEGIINFLNWKTHAESQKAKFTVRTEGNIAAVFSNDLEFLQSLENNGCAVDYTMVDDTIPSGVKYFINEPKHKYRFFLKSKRVQHGFALKLSQWLEKYKGTSTVIEPSNALSMWLNDSHKQQGAGHSYPWRLLFTSGHYYIDYDDESTLTLFMLIFDGMVGKRYTLLKRPE